MVVGRDPTQFSTLEATRCTIIPHKAALLKKRAGRRMDDIGAHLYETRVVLVVSADIVWCRRLRLVATSTVLQREMRERERKRGKGNAHTVDGIYTDPLHGRFACAESSARSVIIQPNGIVRANCIFYFIYSKPWA